MKGLEDRLHDALVDPNPRESEKRIKETVAAALESFDPSATVKVTSYFNHTYAPDMVMVWGREERGVFLRFTDDVPELAHDIDLLDRFDPLVFGLSTPTSEAIRASRVHERSRDAEVLFTTPAAVDELTSRRAPAATDRMLRNSLAHGGRGALVATTDASRLADRIRTGFEAAAGGMVVGTKEALDTIGDYFQEGQARRLNRVIQAVWEGGGARRDQYPGEADLADKINGISLLYLLQFMDTDDRAFWRGVGRGLTLDQLISFAAVSQQENFQHLINANLDVLRARACVVLDMSFYNTDTDKEFRWGIDQSLRDAQGAVTLRGPSFQAFVTRTKDALEPRFPERIYGLSVETFSDRAKEARIVSVDISDGDKHVLVRDDSGTTDRSFLEATTSGLKSPSVDKATVHTPSGRVNVDFTQQTGTGVTKSDNLLADLLNATTGLLVNLQPPQRNALTSLLAVEGRPGSEQLELFPVEVEPEN